VTSYGGLRKTIKFMARKISLIVVAAFDRDLILGISYLHVNELGDTIFS